MRITSITVSRRDELGARGSQLGAFPVRVAHQPFRRAADYAVKEPQRGQPDRCGERRPACRGKEGLRTARLLYRGDHVLQLAYGVGSDGRFRDIPEALDVVVRDGEPDLAVDLDEHALRHVLGRNLVLAGFDQHRADALGGVGRTLLDRHAEHGRAEADDLPIEDDDVRCRA
jgi:hypothetical protein